MKRLPLSFPFKSIFGCLTVTLLFISACENDVAVINSVTAADEKNKPIETSKNVEFLYSDSARVRSRLKTPLVDHYLGKKPYYEMSKGLDVVFYDALQKEQTKLTANYGIGYDNGNNENKMSIMEAKGNVVVINEKGDKLNTEHLIWNSNTKKIYTNEFVKITTKDEVIWGDGLEANEDFSEYEIKHVKGQIAVKDSLVR
jgi:LPS export ABC transporter protein LptC